MTLGSKIVFSIFGTIAVFVGLLIILGIAQSIQQKSWPQVTAVIKDIQYTSYDYGLKEGEVMKCRYKPRSNRNPNRNRNKNRCNLPDPYYTYDLEFSLVSEPETIVKTPLKYEGQCLGFLDEQVRIFYNPSNTNKIKLLEEQTRQRRGCPMLTKNQIRTIRLKVPSSHEIVTIK